MVAVDRFDVWVGQRHRDPGSLKLGHARAQRGQLGFRRQPGCARPIVTTVLPQLRTQWPGLLDKFNRIVAPQLENFGVQLDTDTIKAWVLKSFDGNMDEWGQKLLSSARIGGSWLATTSASSFPSPFMS